ncbi:hypothetical protein G9P44_006202 [Scheffersomyces stipitis]|nr:hypothetical protein G9P44_006202 [Scheffersomyces stipitis]
MGLLQKIFHGQTKNIDSLVLEKGFEVSSCSSECSSCTSNFPKSLSFDNDAYLWESTKPYGLHIVVPTGKTDWPHDACGVSGTFSKQVSEWGGHSSGKFPEIGSIKVTVSSLSSDDLLTNDEYCNEKRGDVLLLPFFVWIRNVSIAQVNPVLDAVVASLVASRKNSVKEIQLSYPQFPSVKIEVDSNQSYVFFCSHKSRDKRCGVTAPIMKKEMDIYLRDLGLYRDVGDNTPGGVKVAFINHIGGHKYAANVIIYLRKSGKNIWLARCKPNNVRPIVDECIVNDGKVWPEKIRLIQKFDSIEW